MKFFTTAILNWFDDGCCDVKYLDLWDHAPVSYRSGRVVGASWHTDYYEEKIGHDSSGELFRIAADLLMRYQFYPRDILSHVSDFGLESRRPQVGDRIAQRIHIVSLFGRPVLDVLGMTEIRDVVAEPHRQGFTYVTVAPHVEQGEWSAHVEWRDNDDVVLTIRAISRPSPQEPKRNHDFMRSLQKKAHRRGIAHFKHWALAQFGVIDSHSNVYPPLT